MRSATGKGRDEVNLPKLKRRGFLMAATGFLATPALGQTRPKPRPLGGGGNSTAKLASLEALNKLKLQAGILIFREANENYVPLGVFNVRENVKSALSGKYREFYTLRDSLNFISSRLRIPISRFIEKGSLLREILSGSQTTLLKF